MHIFLRARCSLVCIRPLKGSCFLENKFGLNRPHALQKEDVLEDELHMIADGRGQGCEANPPNSVLHRHRWHLMCVSGQGHGHLLKFGLAVVNLFPCDAVRVSLSALHVEILPHCISASPGAMDKASRGQSSQGITTSHCFEETHKKSTVQICICITIIYGIYIYTYMVIYLCI